MEQFELISIDMFQTLVNVNSRTSFIWKRILKDKFNDEPAESIEAANDGSTPSHLII